MKKLSFIKMNPCGNTTVFILDSVPRECYKQVSQAIMTPLSVGAEQIGFICASKRCPAKLRMEMMGGEFCGNASRSFAAWLYFNSGSKCFNKTNRDGSGIMDLDVSGNQGLLQTKIQPLSEEATCFVSCSMPLPVSIRHGQNAHFGKYSFVAYEGISHLIAWEAQPGENDIPQAQLLIKSLGYSPDSIGIMYYDSDTKFIRPLVHIEDAGTTVWETSCGSGSCAVAAAMADMEARPEMEYAIHQPGGVLTVQTQRKENRLVQLVLGGDVKLSAQGTLYIEQPETK